MSTGFPDPSAIARKDTALPRLTHDDLTTFLDLDADPGCRRPEPRRRTGKRASQTAEAVTSPRQRPHARPHERKPFRCGRCRSMVEPPASGGRHRNHCPFCLTSRHVDRRRPGDRECDCRALMAPVGTAFRPDGEQLVVHRCNGCGTVRRCRIAADDDPAMLLRLPPYAAETLDAEAIDAEAAEDAIA